MNNLEEMNRLVEKFNLPILNQKEIEIMNNSITSTKTETVIKNFPNKSPGQEGFTGEFYQTFREELMPSLLKLNTFQRKEPFQAHSTRLPSP